MFKIYMVATTDGYEVSMREYFSTLERAQEVKSKRQFDLMTEQGEFQVDYVIIETLMVD